MIELKIKRPVTVMMDHLILEQLSKKVRDQLGAVVETGYHLGYNRRDYFFETRQRLLVQAGQQHNRRHYRLIARCRRLCVTIVLAVREAGLQSLHLLTSLIRGYPHALLIQKIHV